MKLSSLWRILISMPKTVYFNFRSLPFMQAVRLPIFVDYKTKIGVTGRGIIHFTCPLSLFLISFGRGGVNGVISHSHNELWIEKGSMTFSGKASFGEGSSIRTCGELSFGKNFGCGKNSFIACTGKMSFGDSILIGWNCSFRDSNGHDVFIEGKKKNNCMPVEIGNHVWIGAESHILKGAKINDGSIVGYGSVVSNSFEETNVLIAGHPASIIRRNVKWEQ